MAKVKYRIREFKPTANQTGGHSVYAEAVVDNIITNKELASVSPTPALPFCHLDIAKRDTLHKRAGKSVTKSTFN